MLRVWRRLLAFVSIMISFLLGCAEGRAQSVTGEAPSPVILPANTPVIIHLKESLHKKDAKAGQQVEFEVGYDVIVNDQIMIQNGTAVTGSFRQVDHAGKGALKVLIDLGPAKTASGESARLTSSSFSSNGESPTAEAIGMGSAAGPILPGLVIASLFQKKVLLDKDAWGGVWGVARTVDDVALNPAKQKVAQEQYIANRKAAQAERCKLWDSAQNTELLASLWRQGGHFVSDKASLLHQAGDVDGAIAVYQQLLESRPDLLCSDQDPGLSLAAPLFALAGPEKREQLLNTFRAGIHVELAGLYREKRDFTHAVSESRTAVQLDPEDERARIALTDSLEDSGDLDGAVAESKYAVRIWPDKSYFHYLLGRVLVKKNDADAAIAELQWALKQGKNHLSSANCELGRAFEEKGNREAAFRQYRIAYRAHVDDEQCRAAYERLKLLLKK